LINKREVSHELNQQSQLRAAGVPVPAVTVSINSRMVRFSFINKREVSYELNQQSQLRAAGVPVPAVT
ncbi:hypothetical protein J6590_023217, partial [Homalodisca vitripennis]